MIVPDLRSSLADLAQILQLVNTSRSKKSPPQEALAPGLNASEIEEWGEFLHLPGKAFSDFDHIRQEIVNDTELKTGKNAGLRHSR